MSRYIKVDRCTDCPYSRHVTLKVVRCAHYVVGQGNYKNDRGEIEKPYVPPDWCPLPILKEEKITATSP